METRDLLPFRFASYLLELPSDALAGSRRDGERGGTKPGHRE
jgi:hypothetical protein